MISNAFSVLALTVFAEIELRVHNNYVVLREHSKPVFEGLRWKLPLAFWPYKWAYQLSPQERTTFALSRHSGILPSRKIFRDDVSHQLRKFYEKQFCCVNYVVQAQCYWDISVDSSLFCLSEFGLFSASLVCFRAAFFSVDCSKGCNFCLYFEQATEVAMLLSVS